MFTTIVAAIDGSEQSETVARKAGELAALCNAELVLTHVADPALATEYLRTLAVAEHMGSSERTARHSSLPRVPGWFDEVLSDADGSPSMHEVLEEFGKQTLEKASLLARQAGAGDIREVLEDGDPAKRLLEVATREEGDLVVIGSRGLGQIQEFLFGSVSHKVAMTSACPCLIVK